MKIRRVKQRLPSFTWPFRWGIQRISPVKPPPDTDHLTAQEQLLVLGRVFPRVYLGDANKKYADVNLGLQCLRDHKICEQEYVAEEVDDQPDYECENFSFGAMGALNRTSAFCWHLPQYTRFQGYKILSEQAWYLAEAEVTFESGRTELHKLLVAITRAGLVWVEPQLCAVIHPLRVRGRVVEGH